MRRRQLLLGLLVVGLWMNLGGIAFADGGFFPPPVYQKPADIPAQRGLIAFRDGKETLLIESAFSTEAKDVGWIIPLPATPDKIQPVSSGALKTLSFCLQPAITHFMPDWFVMLSIFIIASSLLFMYGMFFGFLSREKSQRSALEWLLVLLIILILGGVLLPSLGTTRAGGGGQAVAQGVKVEQHVRVGSYEVSILKAEGAENLNDWLRQNGFMAVPEEGKPMISDYIAKGWRFAAAKLERTAGGLSTPHPIRFDFKTPTAVYPMKLTALAGSSPELELFLVADKTASCVVLAQEFCDVYRDVPEEKSGSGDEEEGTSRFFRGITFNQDVGHPDLLDILWPNCVITKLSGKLRPEQMKEDLTFSWSPWKSTRQHFFSHRGARLIAIMIPILAVAVFLPVSLAALRKRIRAPGGKLWYLVKLFLPVAYLVSAAGLAFYLVMPKVEVTVSSWRHSLDDMGYELQERGFTGATSVETVVQTVEQMLARHGIKNGYTGGAIIREASPGNYDVRKKDGNFYFIWYDRGGAEHWQRISWPEKR